MRLVVTGGGTGGHIYPALAVTEALRDDPAVESVTYLGKTTGLERELAATAGIPFEGIDFYGMPRGKSPLLPFQLLVWGFRLYQAKRVAKRKLQAIRPDVVFGTGGYVSAPVLLAAQALRIPYVVHEPDARPGLANRLLARDARLITTSFPEGAESLKRTPTQEVAVTGNPIRGDIGAISKADALAALDFGPHWPPAGTESGPDSSQKDSSQEPDTRPILLVTGGSQGSRRINTAVARALPVLLNEWGLAVVHLTGRKLYEETLALLDTINPALRHHPAYRVRPYTGEMAALLALADVAVCRAGSLSLSEMYVSGTPTVLIPYPYAASDHQRKNAQASARAGASRVLEDNDCTEARLLEELRPLIDDPVLRQAMQTAALSLGHPNATADIAACLKRIAGVAEPLFPPPPPTEPITAPY
jgi:UDP-N-acetylglucosamine--N-acetylmuramyl-(pentapeptide) pyrophosphoryl-undecaprenol N-acetylglucosamine transferase